MQAGPKAIALGRHSPAAGAPQAAGASTRAADREANVNTALRAQRAGVAPWQDRDAAAHSRPAAHSVAARGPEKAAPPVPARAPSQAAHEGVAAMPSAAAVPR